MPDDSRNPFLEAANAGLSPIPVDTATKKPLIPWKRYQEAPAETLVLAEWADHNIGIVCGEVSGRLIALDFEGSFVAGGGAGELNRRLAAAGLYEMFYTWMEGYSEATPRDGFHCLVRIEGDGPMEGNRKLAMAPDATVLIETRAEGGYVITAPSRNGSYGWRIWRGGFDSIALCTQAEWLAVVAVLTSFDESSRQPAPPPPPTPTAGVPSMLRLGESWINEALAGLPPVVDILAMNGWRQARSQDSYGQHWVRPDKEPGAGHSASVNHDSGRLWVHSTSAGLPVGVSMDALDLLYALDHHRMPTLEERVEYLRALRPGLPGGGAGQVAEPTPAETSMNLPEEFWASRAALDHIRTAALARRLSPDAVWEAVKCFYAATIPWNHRLPHNGTMDYISLVVGSSGAGKSRAKSEAHSLLEGVWGLEHTTFPVPPGSGEGMTEVFLERSKDAASKYALRGVGFYADEGKWLLDIASRPGNTTMQAVKQLWSGELTGSVAASADRHRWLEPRAVRATLLISATPDIAAQFLRSDLADEGLPQRISWGWAHYPHPDARPDHPGPLRVPTWRPTSEIYQIELDPTLESMIDAQMLARSRSPDGDGHEGHSDYAKLKGAAILAHLDGRMDVNLQDWGLSTVDWEHTRAIRSYLLATQTRHTIERNTSLGEARAHQRMAESDVYFEKAVHSLVTKLKLAKDPLSMRQIKDHLRKFSRSYGVDHREVIHMVVGRGLAREVDGGSFTA